MTVENLHISPQFFCDVISGHTCADTSVLGLRDPDTLIAGNIHACFPAWESIAKISPFKLTPNILRWIQDCVNGQEFFQPFKGQYKGEHFNSALPRSSLMLFHVTVLGSLFLTLLLTVCCPYGVMSLLRIWLCL